MKNVWMDEVAARITDGQVFDAPVDLVGYRRDTSPVLPGDPELVVRPQTVAEVAAVLKAASARAVPVYARGAGSMYAGGVVPQRGGVVCDLAGMNRIIDLDPKRGIVVVEPGVRFGTLLPALAREGWTIGIVPSTGATATIGGAVSAHALGTGSPKFQSMGDEVAGLEVVLADGTVLRTGSAAARQAGFFQRYCIGPDLTGLFLGADATMGIITKIALWLHPAPKARETWCLGFSEYRSGADFLIALQNRERLLDTIWYGGVYDWAAISGRMKQLAPEVDQATLPRLCLALDLRGEAEDIARDRERILALAQGHGGDSFELFNTRYFRTLRYDQTFWYSFAGYFSISRCALLMSSLPADLMPSFLDKVQDWRERHPQFIWGVGSVMCRRGLHGGVIAFYDEARQWDEARQVFARCAEEMSQMGCVPYKSGKIWAEQVRSYSEYHALLRRLKSVLDPNGILGPGNLGL